jgi:hypothetical protein
VSASQFLTVSDAIKLAKDGAQLVHVDGWMIGTDSLQLVDNPEKPSEKIGIPDHVLPALLETVPERLRVGGRYMWMEKIRLTGLIECDNISPSFRVVDSIDLVDVKRKIDFKSSPLDPRNSPLPK